MTAAIAILGFWILGGIIGGKWMRHMIDGFPARWVVEVLALLWGIVVAIVARWLITGLSLGTVATAFTYLLGCVVCGPPRREQSEQLPGALHELEMRYNMPYTKQQIVSTVPLVTYVALGVLLFFLWK